MIQIFVTISVIFIFSLLSNKKKREIPFGELVSYNKWDLEDKKYITEIVKFRDSVECIKYYNKLVNRFTIKVESYEMDGWTRNKIETTNGNIQLFRYGNNIKLIRTTVK